MCFVPVVTPTLIVRVSSESITCDQLVQGLKGRKKTFRICLIKK